MCSFARDWIEHITACEPGSPSSRFLSRTSVERRRLLSVFASALVTSKMVMSDQFNAMREIEMSTDLEQRVTALENDMSDVKQRLGEGRPQKDWRKTVGMSKDDPGFEEMIQLGREIREQDRENDS
jgi:hypothetical protein